MNMAATFAHIPRAAVVAYAWLFFLVVWLIGALRTKRTRARQPGAARVLQVALGLCVWLLVATRHYPVHLLERAVLPSTPFAGLLGCMLLLGGIAFAIVARVSLGRNWSADVTLKEDHQLICTGLYSVVRNPIYTGITAALLGTAMLLNTAHAFLAFAISVPLFMWKTTYEERFMEQEFGAQYFAYRQRVRGFIPFVW
jgi:protein-S-isoprenylcysteine O-methyltransferase Ste14